MLRIKIRTTPLPLSKIALRALRCLDEYDAIFFTSKRARHYFTARLRLLKIKVPAHTQIVHVGPRADVLAHVHKGMRILFPRSSLAPSDILHKIRAHGAHVRTIALYTTHVIPLSKAQLDTVSRGGFSRIYFRSPSGVDGILRQLRGRTRAQILAREAVCIGETTAAKARLAGFRQVSVIGVV